MAWMPVTEALKRLLTSFGLQDYCGVFTELVSNQSFDIFVLPSNIDAFILVCNPEKSFNAFYPVYFCNFVIVDFLVKESASLSIMNSARTVFSQTYSERYSDNFYFPISGQNKLGL